MHTAHSMHAYAGARSPAGHPIFTANHRLTCSSRSGERRPRKASRQWTRRCPGSWVSGRDSKESWALQLQLPGQPATTVELRRKLRDVHMPPHSQSTTH